MPRVPQNVIGLVDYTNFMKSNTLLNIALNNSILPINLNEWDIQEIKKAQKRMGKDNWAAFIGGYKGGDFTLKIKNSFNRKVVDGSWL